MAYLALSVTVHSIHFMMRFGINAEAVSVHLNELNPFVECAYVHDSIKDLLSNDNVSADEGNEKGIRSSKGISVIRGVHLNRLFFSSPLLLENNGFFSGFTLIICAQQDPITVQA